MTPTERLTTWGGNLAYAAAEVRRPTTVDELRELVATAPRARALGSRHSFSAVADTPGRLVSVTDLPRTVEMTGNGRRARVAAGMTFGQVGAVLHDNGRALANLGSLPHITVAGACSTGTHGSGERHRCIAATVAGVELVTGQGEVVRLTRDDADFGGAVLALGCLGVVTHLDIDLVDGFEVAQTVYEGTSLDAVGERLDAVLGAAYSVSVFTRLDDEPRIWVKRRTDEPDPGLGDLLGARPADGPRHPVPGLDPTDATVQGGRPGPWHERLPHFRPGIDPGSSGDEIQSEYFVRRSDGPAAVEALRSVADRLAPVLRVAELRAIAADDLWMGPSQGADLLGLHFTWRLATAEVEVAVGHVERMLAPFDPVPHWGKLFTLPTDEVASRYPRRGDFAALAARLDPDRVFVNDFVAPYLG